MERDGFGQLTAQAFEKGIRLTFGKVEVVGANYDIAVLRLAQAMLDEPKLCRVLLDALRGQLDRVRSSPLPA